MIQAEVICDSISEQGKRLTTFKLRYPKFIHGEAKTHRVLRFGNEGGYYMLEQEVGFMDDPNISRNASSSRAVPTYKLIEEVRSDNERVSFVFWGANQKGMGSREELTGEALHKVMRVWRSAALTAADCAELMAQHGASKELVNRAIEPYIHINVVASGTEWDNFFGLRLRKEAQPEMRALAIAMWEARKASTPKLLKPGEWHLPFCPEVHGKPSGSTIDDDAIKVSVARCARVSYTSFETGKHSTIEEDLKLYNKLVGMQPLHASPAEHQATPDEVGATSDNCKHDPHCLDCGGPCWDHLNEHGNFVGWRQYRKMLPGEAVAPIPEEFL